MYVGCCPRWVVAKCDESYVAANGETEWNLEGVAEWMQLWDFLRFVWLRHAQIVYRRRLMPGLVIAVSANSVVGNSSIHSERFGRGLCSGERGRRFAKSVSCKSGIHKVALGCAIAHVASHARAW